MFRQIVPIRVYLWFLLLLLCAGNAPGQDAVEPPWRLLTEQDAARLAEALETIGRRESFDEEERARLAAIYTRAAPLTAALAQWIDTKNFDAGWILRPYRHGTRERFPLADYQAAMNAGRLFAVRAALEIRDGGAPAAIRDLRWLGRLSRVSSQEPIGGILFALNMRGPAYELAARAVARADTPDQADAGLALARDFAEMHPPVDWQSAQAAETLDLLEWAAPEGKTDLPPGLSERALMAELLKMVHARGRRMLEAAPPAPPEPWSKRREERIAQTVADLPARIDHLQTMTDEAYGREKAERMAPLIQRGAAREKIARCSLGLLQLQAALRVYESRAGRKAPSLKALLPEILQALPADPFSPAGYLYDKNAGEPYSGGPDGDDDRRKKRARFDSGKTPKGDVWLGQ